MTEVNMNSVDEVTALVPVVLTAAVATTPQQGE